MLKSPKTDPNSHRAVNSLGLRNALNAAFAESKVAAQPHSVQGKRKEKKKLSYVVDKAANGVVAALAGLTVLFVWDWLNHRK
ncbi:MAG: hypothetical protein ACYDCC_04670 [Actinomycetota bacterium]